MDALKSIETLIINQEKNWSEIVTGFEARNKYNIMDADGNLVYIAAEWKGSFWTRVMLKSLRPFTIYIMNPNGKRVLILQRPFKFFLHRLEIFDPNWNHLGTIQRRFSVFQRHYSVLEKSERETYHIFGPILHPWTFRIQIPGRDIGQITKKWSGLLKEMFTNADNFAVTFPAELDISRKCLLLGAVFLIDFVHFERRQND